MTNPKIESRPISLSLINSSSEGPQSASGLSKPSADRHPEVSDNDCSLNGNLEYALNYAALGHNVMPLVGKKPLTQHGSKDATTDPQAIHEWWTKWPDANVGLATGYQFFALDVDVKTGGEETLDALQSKHGQLPDTLTQITGSGGKHYCFRMPIDQSIGNSVGKIGPGLDIRGEGGYIVVEPSIHPDTEQRYAFDGLTAFKDQVIADAPVWLLDLISGNSSTRFTLPQTIPNGERNTTLFRLASKMRGAGFDESEMAAAIGTINQTRVEPPLPQRELASIVKSVSQYSPNPARRTTVYDMTPRIEQPEENSILISGIPAADSDWYTKLRLTDSGKPERTVGNVITTLECAPHWHGSFAYDEFCLKAHATKPLLGGVIASGTAIGDHEISLITAALQNGDGISAASGIVAEAVAAVAKLHPFHPVRDYLASLEWDGEPRVDGLLINYFGAEPSNYVAAIGRCFLISAIARVYQPGCKVDSMLILEGPQGIGKSTGFRVLGKPWFTDDIGDLGSKDTLLQLLGNWIVELSELDALSRSETSHVKAFISRQVDNYRPPYARVAQNVPRQNVFVGTVNHDTYLKDETGNRRFWPVRVQKINLQALRADRDQIWAEAKLLYEEGTPWHLNTPQLQAEAAEYQASRVEEDVWMSTVEEYCTTRDDVTIDEVLSRAIGKNTEQWTQADRNRVGRCLRILRYQRYRHTNPNTGERRWRYRKRD